MGPQEPAPWVGGTLTAWRRPPGLAVQSPREPQESCTPGLLTGGWGVRERSRSPGQPAHQILGSPRAGAGKMLPRGQRPRPSQGQPRILAPPPRSCCEPAATPWAPGGTRPPLRTVYSILGLFLINPGVTGRILLSKGTRGAKATWAGRCGPPEGQDEGRRRSRGPLGAPPLPPAPALTSLGFSRV